MKTSPVFDENKIESECWEKQKFFFYMLNAAVIGKKKVVSDFDKDLNK